MSAAGSAPGLELVEFKWLMTGAGWWVDLTRLDRAYARECMQHAAASGSALLCRRAAEVLGGGLAGSHE